MIHRSCMEVLFDFYCDLRTPREAVIVHYLRAADSTLYYGLHEQAGDVVISTVYHTDD